MSKRNKLIDFNIHPYVFLVEIYKSGKRVNYYTYMICSLYGKRVFAVSLSKVRTVKSMLSVINWNKGAPKEKSRKTKKAGT